VTSPIIAVENLTKRYGDTQALRGVSFSVQEGEVFGLLGPNGAGKTSTVEILEGMRPADGGRAEVCGLDPHSSGSELKELIGAVLQFTALPDKIRVSEALNMFASFYRRHRDTGQLLQRFGLEEKRRAFYSQLSGGQKQRLALAMALVNQPRVLFLDEPTAGLDHNPSRLERLQPLHQLSQAGAVVPRDPLLAAFVNRDVQSRFGDIDTDLRMGLSFRHDSPHQIPNAMPGLAECGLARPVNCSGCRRYGHGDPAGRRSRST